MGGSALVLVRRGEMTMRVVDKRRREDGMGQRARGDRPARVGWDWTQSGGVEEEDDEEEDVEEEGGAAEDDGNLTGTVVAFTRKLESPANAVGV